MSYYLLRAAGRKQLTSPAMLLTTTTTIYAAPSIDITTSFSSALVVQGATVNRIITLTRSGGYSGVVSLSISGLPSGVSGSFSPSSLSGGTLTSTLTLTASGVAPIIVSDPCVITASGVGVADDTINMTLTVSDLAHYGTADLPAITPSFIRTNNNTAGDVHTPVSGAELQTLLTGGTLSGEVLKAGDTIILQRGTNYSSTPATSQHVFPKITGASKANPIRKHK